MGDLDLVQSFLGLTLLGAEWVLWLLVFLSIFSLAVIIERIFYFFKTQENFGTFQATLSGYISKGDFEKAEGLCASYNSLASQAACEGIRNRKLSRDAVEASMEGYIVGQRKYLDRGLVVLGTLGNNAPFIGLFGTVIGIIKAFHDLALNPEGGPSVVMAGISEALVATAVGLLVAIPAVIAFNVFTRIVKNRVANAQALSKVLLMHLFSQEGERG